MTDSYSVEEAMFIARKAVDEAPSPTPSGDVAVPLGCTIPVGRALLQELGRLRAPPNPGITWRIEPIVTEESSACRWRLVKIDVLPPTGHYMQQSPEERCMQIGLFCYRWQARQAMRHLMQQPEEVKAS